MPHPGIHPSGVRLESHGREPDLFHRRIRIRCEPRRLVRPVGRRHLHEGRGCRSGPGGQGRSGDPGRRPEEPGGHCRPRRRQRGRLRGPRGRSVRVHCGGEHRRDGPRCRLVSIFRDRGRDLPAGCPVVRSPRKHRRSLRRPSTGGRGTDDCVEPWLHRCVSSRGNPVRFRSLGDAPTELADHDGSMDLGVLLGVRPQRHGDGCHLRLGHAVLYRSPVSTREGHREILGDRTGDQHHLGLRGGPRSDRDPSCRGVDCDPGILLARGVYRDTPWRHLRDGHCDDGNARHGSVHPGHGHFRAHRGQRRRDHRDVRHVRGRSRKHGQTRCGGQHDESPHERLCRRKRGPRGVPAVQRLPHRSPSEGGGPRAS